MTKIGIIAQNFDIYEGDGLDSFARTGEISAKQILRAGAQGVILGHSETGDTPEVIHEKLISLQTQNIPLNDLVILIGESWDEFEKNTPKKVAELMIKKCEIIFKDISPEHLKKIIVGYEPKWGSRGSGRDDMHPPSPEFISACISEMRLFFKEKYGTKVNPYFIYGGRSTPERTKQILADKNIDGLILGSACNTIKKTLDIANTMKDVCKNRKKVLVCNFKAYDLSESFESYIEELSKLPDDFVLLLAPAHTDLTTVNKILGEQHAP